MTKKNETVMWRVSLLGPGRRGAEGGGGVSLFAWGAPRPLGGGITFGVVALRGGITFKLIGVPPPKKCPKNRRNYLKFLVGSYDLWPLPGSEKSSFILRFPDSSRLISTDKLLFFKKTQASRCSIVSETVLNRVVRERVCKLRWCTMLAMVHFLRSTFNWKGRWLNVIPAIRNVTQSYYNIS